jgi:predicted phage baseplate assembly protein
MPIESFIPQIDDRRYDDILAEIRTRIARYTPEWTPVWSDVNDNDPGITLAQVFAWLSEMLLYRMGKVPELNYLKFLQLIGIELNAAEPALAEVTFPVLEDFAAPYVIIPPRTQVSAESAAGEPPIIFETTRSLTALTARLTSVQAFDGFDFTDVSTENNEPGQGFQPFGPLANADSAVMLGFNYKDEFPEAEIDLRVTVLQEPGNTMTFQECGLPQTPVFPSVTLAWEYWNGREWRSLSLRKDETAALAQSGHILLKTPAKKSLQRAKLDRIEEERYWIRGRIASGGYQRPPKLLAIRTNTVPAEQAESIRDEVLGGSNGRPNQIFKLANAPVLRGSLQLEVDEGEGLQLWTPVDDFFGSSPNDRHYVLNRATGEILMGDGMNGAIPVGNVDNLEGNVVAREYRTGGGKRGNVPAGTLKTLLTSVAGVDENGIANLQPAHSGRDEESLVEAKKRAPRALKSKCRAVTGEDFETLAMQAATIERAKALPLFHPNFPGVKVPGVITVVVVPDSDEPNPMPSEGTLRTVCAYLNQRRLLTTELYVVKPTYQEVRIEAEVIAQNDADLAEVKTGIEQTLLRYFHPLKGGDNSQGWPFGGNIFFSKVFQQAFAVAGVQSIERLVIIVDGEEQLECKDVIIPEPVLLFSRGHEVTVSYAFDE